MTGAVLRGAYRSTMTLAAGLAAVGAHLPPAARRWPTLAGRLGALPATEQATARGCHGRIGCAQVLLPPIVNRSHAFLDRPILVVDPEYPGVSQGLLQLAI